MTQMRALIAHVLESGHSRQEFCRMNWGICPNLTMSESYSPILD